MRECLRGCRSGRQVDDHCVKYYCVYRCNMTVLGHVLNMSIDDRMVSTIVMSYACETHSDFRVNLHILQCRNVHFCNHTLVCLLTPSRHDVPFGHQPATC